MFGRNVPRGTIKRFDHSPIKWSERRIVLIETYHGRDEILAKVTFKVEDCVSYDFDSLFTALFCFVKPMVPGKECGKHHYALIAQAPTLDLFGNECWEDISISWF